MSVPAERLPGARRQVNRQALARRQGLTEPLRLTEGITRGDIASTLRDVARQMDETIRTGLRAGTLSEIGERQLQAVKASLEATAQRMWVDIEKDIRAGIADAASLAVDQQLLRDLQMGMPPGILSQYSDNMVASGLQSAEDLVSRHTNGFTLSQRVYRNNQATVAKVGRIIDLGLAQQLSARQIALQVRSLISPAVKGGVSYAAQRLARTEINNAHHETTIRTSRERPWVHGYKWNLSGSHPRPDICNTYAGDDHSEMGAGVFAKGDVPSKPHPQCLCYLSIAQEPQAEFIRKLREGQYDDYLGVQGAGEATEAFHSLQHMGGKSPVVSEREGMAFSQGSSFPQEFIHGTRPANRQGILDDGFDFGRLGETTNNGGMMGSGAYLTESESVAAQYAMGAPPLRMRVNVTNPVNMDAEVFQDAYRLSQDLVFYGGKVDERFQYLVDAVGGKDALMAALEGRRWGQTDALRLLLKGQGHDSAVRVVGGVIDELAVFDSTSMVVIAG